MTAPRICKGWNDSIRKEQFRRLRAVPFTKASKEAASKARQAALELRAREGEGNRRVPLKNAFMAVLALFRTAYDFKITDIEISMDEIAECAGQHEKTTQRVVDCMVAIGAITRKKRTGAGAINGVWQRIYRTSVLSLTSLGKLLLGIADDPKPKPATKWVPRAPSAIARVMAAAARGFSAAPKPAAPEISPPSWDEVLGDPSVHRLGADIMAMLRNRAAMVTPETAPAG